MRVIFLSNVDRYILEDEIIISSQLKNANMDQTTKDWFMMYDHKEIIRPDKFLPDRKFIEYHNDVIFQK